jgi:hydroxyacylglutathione hydrolase
LTPAEVQERMQHGAIVVDVRDSAAYGAGHIPGSLNIGLGGQYASWAGTLLDANAELIIVADSAERAEEAVMRLARVGLENVAGSLGGGIAAWSDAGLLPATLPQIDVNELAERLGDISVLDVRRPGEYESGHVPDAINIPLDALPERVRELDPATPLAVICAGGYRSSAAASILQHHHFANVSNVVGGTSAWFGLRQR